MTPTVTKISSSRSAKGAPESSVCGSASAAASEIAPRMPLQPTARRSRQSAPVSARAAAGTARPSSGGTDCQAMRTPITTRLTSAMSASSGPASPDARRPS